LSDQLTRVTPDENGEAAEPALARAPQQIETGGRICREHRRCAPAESRGDSPLRPGIDVEDAQCQRLAARSERPRRRGDALPLGKRSLEREQPVPGRLGALGDVVALY